RVTLWTISILVMLAGSLGVIIYNKPLGLTGLGTKSIAGTVYFNCCIALHCLYLIGTGFEVISRAYLVMVGSTCSEQRRVFLCCFLYSMSAWWKLMVIMGVITVIIMAGVSALVIFMEGFKNINIIRVVIAPGVSVIQILFTSLSFVTSRTLQKKQDEEELALHGDVTKDEKKGDHKPAPKKKEEDSSSSKESGPAVIQSKGDSDSNSAIMP
ncbi:hypothetical protein SAMD00019534_021290, partial [Acytostelium subglobosum LB1]|uniref:hypothetical protein n=1 Tax=Acytostelium subglobosum LB1 TaxID=1410327 RepID=UPI00064497A9